MTLVLRFVRLLSRAIRLRCPRCGVGRLFHGFFAMKPSCDHCQLMFERESGFFLGAIYFNYGVTAIVITIVYPLLTLSRTTTRQTALIASLVFSVLFPIWFFRYARSLWLAFDFLIDPRETQ